MPLVSHLWDTNVGSISIYSLLIWFLIIGSTSYVLYKFNNSFISFLMIGTPYAALSTFLHSSFGFLSFGHHPKFDLSLFFVPVDSCHTEKLLILSQFILCWFDFSSLGWHSMFYISLIIHSLVFSWLGHHPRLYLHFFIVPLVSYHLNTILYSALVYSLFLWILVIRKNS